mmetsp:Transcript_946/g.1969  ORF Transcript_946/g.1969 Transcript_946/m.1969 type:complete len:209 (+) Transcript_946:2049-2675(+)
MFWDLIIMSQLKVLMKLIHNKLKYCNEILYFNNQSSFAKGISKPHKTQCSHKNIVLQPSTNIDSSLNYITWKASFTIADATKLLRIFRQSSNYFMVAIIPSAKLNEGSLSPVGSSSLSLTLTALISPSTTCMAKRLQRPGPSTSMGPGCVSSKSHALVNLEFGSPRKVSMVSAVFCDFAQFIITAPSLTARIITSCTPLARRASCFST